MTTNQSGPLAQAASAIREPIGRDLSRREMCKRSLALVSGGLLCGPALHRSIDLPRRPAGYGSGTYGGR